MLAVEGLSKSFGGVAAIHDVSLKFAPGSLTAIIGPNGAGKTTFFNLISGAIRPDKGRVTLAGEDIVGLPPAQIVRRGIARSFQIASIFPSLGDPHRDGAGAPAAGRADHAPFPAAGMPRARLRGDGHARARQQGGGRLREPLAWRAISWRSQS